MSKVSFIKRVIGVAALSVAAILSAPMSAVAQTTLRVVVHSDLKILDPIWTTAYIVRNHGYMVYDTLFAMDAKGAIKPQMLDKYAVSADQLLWTFTLRDGLLFHDGQPVTSEDVIASLKRWSARDSIGQKLATMIREYKAVDEKTFTIALNSPTGLMLQGLGKPSSNVPFIMPKRIAETSPNEQIKEYIGSGPFVFRADEWQPGDKAVYVKFDKYRPRSEPPSRLSGGKVVKVDRVEWKIMPDVQTAVNALKAGEVDMIEQVPHDLLPVLSTSPDVDLLEGDPLGNQYTFRFNTLTKPFDNPKIRQAVFYALNQEDFLKAVIGNPKHYKVCKSFFICDTEFSTTAGMGDKLESNFKKSRQLLKEAKYDGTPVLLMHSTDLQVLTNLAPVAKSLLEKGGFKVDMQSMDWQTLVSRRAKKDPVSEGGWSAFITNWVAADVLNPVSHPYVNANCDNAQVGWPCDSEIEALRDQFSREADPVKQKAIAEKVQLREFEYPTLVPLGQWYVQVAKRKNIDGFVPAPAFIAWNISKK